MQTRSQHIAKCKSRNIYGSSRLGTTNDTINMFVPKILPSYGILGNRTYELSNHLGNVLTVINDVKYPLSDDNVSISRYEVGINGISDYSPLGAPLDSRTVGRLSRIGFNGMEKDDEWKGDGNSYDFGARMYDSRLGRWLSIDALARKYPDNVPYSFSANNPIFFKDKDGDEVVAYSKEAKEVVLKTLKYVFGENHGFEFVGNKLVLKEDASQSLTSQQNLMYKYFNEVLVESTTITKININSTVSERSAIGMEPEVGGIVNNGDGTTFYYSAEKKYSEKKPNEMQFIVGSYPALNDIVITPNLMKDGIHLSTQKGDKLFGVEHAILHEIAHSIMNTILNEFDGKYNGIDFNSMNKEERSDWAIRYTNTLLKSERQSLETGKGQHGRKSDEYPSKDNVKPLNK